MPGGATASGGASPGDPEPVTSAVPDPPDAGKLDPAPGKDQRPSKPSDPPDSGGPSSGDACGPWQGSNPIRTLFIGNSQIMYWELHNMVANLSDSASAECPRIEAHAFLEGGANLGDLIDSGALAEIGNGNYDVVVITESIDLADFDGFEEVFVRDATAMVEASRSAGAIPILYATPFVEEPDHWGFREMADPQIALGEDLGVTVAAGGLAWLKVWDQLPDINLYDDDRKHPGSTGSYISAGVIYAAITGNSPVGLSGDICSPGDCPPVEGAELPVLQQAAWEQHVETGKWP